MTNMLDYEKVERTNNEFVATHTEEAVSLVQKFLWLYGFQRAEWKLFERGWCTYVGELICYNADSDKPHGTFGQPEQHSQFTEWRELEKKLITLGVDDFKCSL